MYSEKTEIVDVITIVTDAGEESESTSYQLTKKAGDLYATAKSGTVIRRHDVYTGDYPDEETHYAYVGLSEVALDSNGYLFKFESGDQFTASDADAYPTSETLSDAIAGGGSGGGSSGGGVLVVNLNMETQTLDKTWKEIHDAMLAGGAVIQKQYDGGDETFVSAVTGAYIGKNFYDIKTAGLSNEVYHASSASGYPVAEGSI